MRRFNGKQKVDLNEAIFSCQTHQPVDFLTHHHSADITTLLHVLMSPTQNHLKSFHFGEGQKYTEFFQSCSPRRAIWHFIKHVPIFKFVHTIR